MQKMLVYLVALPLLVVLAISVPWLVTIAMWTLVVSIVSLATIGVVQLILVFRATRSTRFKSINPRSLDRYAGPDGKIDWVGAAHGEDWTDDLVEGTAAGLIDWDE